MMDNKKENMRMHMADTMIHKGFLIQSCLKMIDYLYECGRYDDALELARRCSLHDHSKLSEEEIDCFVQLPNEKSRKKSNKSLTREQKKLLEKHWKNNRHHPEYHEDYHDMTEIDILEMCCDWHSRTLQFGTSFMDFVMTRAKERFGFDEDFFNKILAYCYVLNKK